MILGLAARIGRFCTLGAIEDFLYSSDDRRLRMWGVAIGVAIITTALITSSGLMDPLETAYLDRVWNPIATVIGGVMFGYGMALAGNCGYGALARLGGGDLRSFVIVLVLGLSAYFVMSGPLAELRVWIFPVITDPEFPQGLGQFTSVYFGIPAWISAVLIGGAILFASLFSMQMLRSWNHLFWGAVVGLAITSGWAGTYYVFAHGFAVEPIETHTFAAPIGDTIIYSMTASGNTLSFSVGSVAGVIIGAFLGSLIKGHFRWEACEDPRELKRQILGAALMGPGAILAVGCSVGQGLSAFSVLAFSAPVTFVSIFLGAKLGLQHLIVGFSPAE